MKVSCLIGVLIVSKMIASSQQVFAAGRLVGTAYCLCIVTGCVRSQHCRGQALAVTACIAPVVSVSLKLVHGSVCAGHQAVSAAKVLGD